MKKLLFLLLCLALTSCRSAMSPSDAMANAVTNGTGLPGSYHIYYSDADVDSPHYPTDVIKEKLYTDGYDVDALCDSYAVLIGDGDIPYEIHLLRARSQSNVSDLLACVDERRELLTEHKNSAFNSDTEERVEQAVSYCAGKYVVLLVTDDNDGMRKLLNEYIL